MITNNYQLLDTATEVTKLGLTYTKYCIRFIDVVYKRRIESDDSTIHTGTPKPDAF